MYDILPRSSDTVLGIRIRAPFTDTDIDRFRRWLGAYVPHFGPLGLLVMLNQERSGERLTMMWHRLAYNIDLDNDLRRIALVGTVGRPTWYGQVARRLTDADVRCFRAEELDEAWAWVNQGKPAPTLLPAN